MLPYLLCLFNRIAGYITKDQGQPHCHTCVHNIRAQELTNGRRDHVALLRTFDDNKKIFNLRNFFNECYRFSQRSLYPLVVPIDVTIMYMLQSDGYILSPDFIATYKKINRDEATVLWKLVHDAEKTTLADVRKLLFDPR